MRMSMKELEEVYVIWSKGSKEVVELFTGGNAKSECEKVFKNEVPPEHRYMFAMGTLTTMASDLKKR